MLVLRREALDILPTETARWKFLNRSNRGQGSEFRDALTHDR
jgi:hypothetical protein